MHLLVDALSVSNLSGRHVLLGHLVGMAASLTPSWRFTLLTHDYNADLAEQRPSGVAHERIPVGPSWWSRESWMRRHGRELCRRSEVDAVFSPSGMLSPGCSRPQIVLAQNPWPFLSRTTIGKETGRAWLQRQAFAQAQRNAAAMVFNSRYMQELYAAHFGTPRGIAAVAYQGIDELLFEKGANATDWHGRRPMVLSVSVMARHKAVEVLVDAFARLAARQQDAELVLVGGWPDGGYRQEVEAKVRALGMGQRVQFEGHVDQARLHTLYAQARVFCLLSRCESFGIPAVEAQAFGTPTVVAEGTAAPEIVGGGGVRQDDPNAAATAIWPLLTDETAWTAASAAARKNVHRFHWRVCTQPLVRVLEQVRSRLD